MIPGCGHPLCVIVGFEAIVGAIGAGKSRFHANLASGRFSRQFLISSSLIAEVSANTLVVAVHDANGADSRTVSWHLFLGRVP
jgi:hypothetical protein